MCEDHAESTLQRSGTLLPLESSAVALDQGWVVRLSVRAERILVAKQLEVYERVVVRRHEIEDLSRVDASVRREQLTVEFDPDVSPARCQDDAIHKRLSRDDAAVP